MGTVDNVMPEDEPAVIPSEEGYLQAVEAQGSSVTDALLRQGQALTTLMAHLVGHDSLGDIASSSTSLSTKGSMKIEKLQQELASRCGNFFLQVSQNAFKRIKPGEL